jgi:hypothetical protein
MEFYTLDANFNKETIIEGYTSAIWTERYSKSGDFEIVFTDKVYSALSQVDEGAFIQEKDSIRVGIIEEQIFKDGTVTVKGNHLENFLAKRPFRTAYSLGANVWSLFSTSPRFAMWTVMFYFCTDTGLSANVPGMKFKDREAFSNLEIGLPDQYSEPLTSDFAIPFGNIYDALNYIAEPNGVGWRFYPVPNGSSYDLFYNSYYGVDRSFNQSAVPPVIFSQDLDTLKNIEELHSMSSYITTAHTFAPKIDPSEYSYNPAEIVGYAEAPGSNAFRDFDRRSIAVSYDDITPEDYHWWNSSSDNGILKALDVLNARATDLIANNNFIRIVDGEIVHNNENHYNRDYFMGDIVTLKGAHGAYQNARIIEYIRSEDGTGHKEYPTITVV